MGGGAILPANVGGERLYSAGCRGREGGGIGNAGGVWGPRILSSFNASVGGNEPRRHLGWICARW
jgi:hypothetical protein